MLAIQSQTFNFTEPGISQYTFNFNNTIKDYGAALQGFNLNFGVGHDHEIQSLGAEITNASLNTDQTEVTVEVQLTLNDNSKNLGKGEIDIVVFADLKT